MLLEQGTLIEPDGPRCFLTLTEMITYSERYVVGETVTKMQEEIFHKQ